MSLDEASYPDKCHDAPQAQGGLQAEPLLEGWALPGNVHVPGPIQKLRKSLSIIFNILPSR